MEIEQLFPPVLLSASATVGAAGKLDDGALLDLYSSPKSTKSWLSFNFVSSVDGAASVAGLSEGLGNAADQHIFGLLRRPTQAILVGAGTIRAEGYGGELLDEEARSWRLAHGLSARPRLVIFSGSLDLAPDLEVFTNAPETPLIVTTRGASKQRREALAGLADVVSLDEGPVGPALLKALGGLGLTRVHCEGGPSLLGTFAQAGVVDELALTLSPLLVAGPAGRIAHSAEQAVVEQLELAHILKSESMLFLRYLRTGK